MSVITVPKIRRPICSLIFAIEGIPSKYMYVFEKTFFPLTCVFDKFFTSLTTIVDKYSFINTSSLKLIVKKLSVNTLISLIDFDKLNCLMTLICVGYLTANKFNHSVYL